MSKKQLVISYTNPDLDWIACMYSYCELLKNKLDTDKILVSFVDLREDKNIFVVLDENIKNIISKIFTIEFTENIAIKEWISQRKEIIPLVLEYKDKLK